MSSTYVPVASSKSRWPIISRANAEVLATFTHRASRAIARWGLVGILLGFGLYKFTAVEAAAIQPLVANSPIMGFLYSIASVQGVSNIIGVSEIIIATLLALHSVAPRAAVAGGLCAAVMFTITSSFLFTTPGALSNAMVLGFLVKDVFLLGAALLATTESLRKFLP